MARARLAAVSASAGSGGGSKAAGSRVMTAHGHAPRTERPERPDPGRIDRWRDDHGGHPAPQPAHGDDERLDERRRAVGLDGRQHLHDLEVLSSAAVGGQVRGP